MSRTFAFGFKAAVALAMLSLLANCGQPKRPAMGPPVVGVVVVKPQSVPLTTELPARTEAYETSDVRPQVTGILQSILFQQGGYVHAGQPLYQIDPAPYRAAYDSAKAALGSAEANLVATKLQAERYAELKTQNAIALQTYDNAVATYKQALATVQQDKANLESARINLGYTRITAPISGRIGRSIVTPGALLTADQTTALATIQTLDPIYVDMDQSSTELVQLQQAIQAGQITRNAPVTARVTLELADGTTYPYDGTLQFSEVTVDPNTGAVVLRALFPNPKGLLLPGMYVRATIVEGIDREAMLVPQQAVSRDERGQPTAYRVDANGIARLIDLTAPRTYGSYWLVTKGLKAGDRIIVQGLQRVEADAPVRAVPATTDTGGS